MSVFQALGIVGAVWLAYFAWRVFFWVREGRRMRTPGYLPPPPSWFGRTAYLLGARFAHWLAIGKIKVIGRENANQKGRLLVLANHQHGLDFAPVRLAVPFSYRQIGALKEVTKVPGMAAFSAFIGTFSVPVVGGKSTQGHQGANPAIDAVATILASSPDAKQLVFPQGKLVFNNKLLPDDFRTGATRALKIAAEKIGHGDDLYVLPLAIHYDTREHGITWFRKAIVWTWRRCFGKYMSGPKFGTTVVVGKPIPYKSLPENPREAIEHIRQRIQEQLDIAIANT